MDNKESSILSDILLALSKHFSGSNKEAVDQSTGQPVTKTADQSNQLTNKGISPLTPVIKQFKEEEMIAVEILYCPPDEPDAHGDYMSAETITKMVEDFNLNIDNISGNIAHYENTDKIKPIKAWVNEVDSVIGDQFIPEGTPLVKVKFHDPVLWQARKDGILMGVSIGAMGNYAEE